MHDFPTEEEIKIGRATMALQRELAEARAQIKEQAKDAYFTQQRLTEERDEARAQIAAKDAVPAVADVYELAKIIGYRMAKQVSRNNMPDMSGDPRNRIPQAYRRSFDDACLATAEAILAVLKEKETET